MSFIPIFNTETALLVKALDDLVDEGEMDLIPLLQRFTLSIATRE